MAFLDEPAPKAFWKGAAIYLFGWGSMMLLPLAVYVSLGASIGRQHQYRDDYQVDLLLLFLSPLILLGTGIAAFIAHGSSGRWAFRVMATLFIGWWILLAATGYLTFALSMISVLC